MGYNLKIMILKASSPADTEVAAYKSLWGLGSFSRVGAQKLGF